MQNFYYNTSILYWARHLDLKKKKILDKNSDAKRTNKTAHNRQTCTAKLS